jgi:leucyl-tRNA synthetase
MLHDPNKPPSGADAAEGTVERELWKMEMAGKFAGMEEEIERTLHRTIKKVGDDIEAFKFNTAISAMMEFVNAVYNAGRIRLDQAERFVLILAPFAPHLAEELWQRLGHANTLAYEPWPAYDPAALVESEIEMPVQVNGKLRGVIRVPAAADQAAVEAAAHATPNVQAHLEGKTIRKVIVVKGKLINIVAS